MPRTNTSHEISYIEDTGQVKFYLRRPVHLYVPTALKEDDYDPLKVVDPPSQSLQLEWVHGYRGKDGRNNLLVLASGEVLYFTAGVVVLYNVEANEQRQYVEHTDDIKSLAVHPDGETVASGQVKGCDDDQDDANIRVWNSTTLETLHVLGTGDLGWGVCALAFSKADDGALLAAVEDAQEPKLSVWQWQKETKISDMKCSSDPVIAVNFSTEEPPRIVTTGKNSIAFWTLEDGSTLEKSTGVFGSTPKPKYITSVSFTPDGETLTGDSNGNILVWAKGSNEISRTITEAHQGSVFDILPLSGGRGFLTSGKDRLLKQWDANFFAAETTTELPEELDAGRVVVEVAEGTLVVGTISNILAKGGMDQQFSVITKGSLDEIWGLATHPTQNKFLSGALDSIVTERNMDDNTINWSIKVLKGGVQSVCYSPDGEVVLVGTTSGTLIVYNASDQELLLEKQAGSEPLQVVQFSPDGSLLAVGSRDNDVYLYETEDDFRKYKLRGTCSGHSSFIRSLDFSSDGSVLRTNSGDYELLFWQTSDCTQDTNSSELRDTEWATRTCLLCFENFGVWPKGVDGTDLNAVAGAHNKDLVVTADDFGQVNLFGGKTHFAYAGHKRYRGHSSHVTNVAFSYDDEKVLSVGGSDCSIFQWKLSDE
uniref:Echinoderm microtubule-associated protein-like 2 n=2 Tax=Hirondellea gigas TaxID=1518452 RepID=A0A2P2I3H0_9CRUS